MFKSILGQIQDLFKQQNKPKPISERISRYKIDKHPAWGYCAFYDESPNVEIVGRMWHPIGKNATTTYSRAEFEESKRGELWLPSEELAGMRINRHASRDGIIEIWREPV